MGANGIILKTINSGAEWVKQTSNTTNQLNSVFFIDQNHGNIVGFNGDFLYTSDGGVTWRLRTGPIGNSPYAMSIYFCDNDTGYAFGAYTAFYSTTDSGNNWEGKIIIDVTNPPPNKHIRCGYFVDCNIGYAVGTNYYNTYSKELILKTTNGGKDWIDLTTYSFNELNSVWFVDANNGYAVGSKGTIIKTTNGGTNWSIQTSGTIKDLFSVFFTSPDTGYIVGNNGTILKTLNGGLAWVKDELKTDLINIFPNPSSSKLNIESIDINKEMIITILNINGQEIIYRSIKDKKFQIDISNLNSGIYFLKIVIDNKVEFKKIIKK